MDAVIEVEGLTMGYEDRVIMEDLNFSIWRGGITAIMGGSGCGKSTLLKHLTGLYAPQSGDIKIFGQSIVHSQGDAKSAIMRKFGVAYQGGALFTSMSVAENVEFPLIEYTNFSRSERQQVVQQKLDMVGLGEYGDFMPGELSGGMKKRAGLARALALEPELLFFDEPSAGLDPVSSAELDRLIAGLRDDFGATVVLVTHELDSVFSIADRILILDRTSRGIIADGPAEYLRDHSENQVVRCFLTRDGSRREG